MKPKAEVYTIQGRGMAARWATVAGFDRLADAIDDARARNHRRAQALGLTPRIYTVRHGWQPGWYLASIGGKDGQSVY